MSCDGGLFSKSYWRHAHIEKFNPHTTRKIVNSRNIRWADWHGQTSPIDGLKDFNVEGDTEIVDISIEDEKQDKDVVPVVPPPVQQGIMIWKNLFQL